MEVPTARVLKVNDHSCALGTAERQILGAQPQGAPFSKGALSPGTRIFSQHPSDHHPVTRGNQGATRAELRDTPPTRTPGTRPHSFSVEALNSDGAAAGDEWKKVPQGARKRHPIL